MTPRNKPLYVTKPFLPPIEQYVARIQTIWDDCQLTNNGSLVRELEQRLKDFLKIDHVIPVTNGDAGLRICYRALELTGEVLTTPFSYVSTSSSLLWSNLTPVFCDIDDTSLTVDPELVEKAITSKTSAMLMTHVFGNPCDVEALQAIAQKHKLKLIYDAAHAFNVDYQNKSILEFGDVSMLSLHATKLFHSAEGGLLATQNAELADAIEWRRRFGHNGPEEFHGVGINAKMTELNAAMGLCVLDHIDEISERRQKAASHYDNVLIEKANGAVAKPKLRSETRYNYAYYPILFSSEETLLKTNHCLGEKQIYPRRYFYPSLNSVKALGEFKSCPVSESVARRILCLPFSSEITESEIEQVAETVLTCVS